MDTDEQLLERVRSGDLPAFDELYARYERSLFGFLLANLKNRTDAEDAFHEAFLGALKNEGTRFEAGGFRAFLFRVAKNNLHNRRRSASRGANALSRLDPPEPAPTPHARLEERDQQIALDTAVARLPPPLEEVYRLRSSGLSYDEIAAVLETPIGTVKSRMHEMVQALRKEMRSWTAGG